MATVTENLWLEAFGTVLREVEAELPGAPGALLAESVRAYVLDGVGVPPQPAVTSTHSAALERLSYPAAWPADGMPAQHVLTRCLEAVAGPVALRWLTLQAALLQHGPSGGSLDLPDGARWPTVLPPEGILHAATGTTSGVPLGLVEATEEAAGWRPGTTLAAALSARGLGWPDAHLVEGLLAAPDLAAALLRRHAVVAQRFGAAVGVEGLVLARALVLAGGAVVDAYADLVAALLTSASKQTRTAAEPLGRLPEAAAGPVRTVLQRIASTGTTDERSYALSVLHEMASAVGDRELVAHVRALAAGDDAAAVRRLAQAWAAADAAARPEAGGGAVVPAVEAVTVDWSVELTPRVRSALAGLWRFLDGYDDRPVPSAVRLDLERFLASPAALPDRAQKAGEGPPLDALRMFAPTAGPVAAFKVLAFLGKPSRYESWVLWELLGACEGLDLLTAAALLEPFDVSPREVLDHFSGAWRRFGHDWADEAVWPFLVHHGDDLLSAIQAPPTWSVDRERLFALLDTLPAFPPPLLRVLFDVALGTGKRDRPLAQKALARVEGKSERIVAALGDGKAEVRAAAARWLGDLGDAAAVPALEAAWRKEKQDVAKAAVLDALEVLGRPVEAYLDLDGLLADAAKTAAKPLPAALDWVPWEVLPAVRWADGTAHAGQPVPLDLVRHLAVQAVKAKSPEPNALLRRYCALWERAGGAALAQRLLEGWLAHDVAPISRAEAEQRTDAEARMWHASLTSTPQYHPGHPWLGWSLEQITAALLPSRLTIPAGSAIDSKGLLALVAATADGGVAPPVNRYLKQWYGHRTAQAKALLGMLAHVDHPAATALLLSVGNRFRTKGIQDEANRLAAALAERHGWTVDELADRTVPSAGLDDEGVLVLDYGPRQFTAVLAADLTLALRSPDGTAVKALPAARSDDDADLVAAAKKALATARKELKATVEQQSTRLYEAMCTGREWVFDDWNRYLLPHPVMRHLVQRLVWAQTETADDGAVRVVGLFRPLADGSLTDADDEPVTVPPDARIRLAHDAFLPADDVAAWTTHLADYEVAPLFGQLGAGFWAVPADRAKEHSVDDFVGHALEAFALRGRATKLGWTRGQAEDGGVFTTYRKRFPSLGLEAVVGFTGNTLPEENRTVALGSLHIERVLPGGDPWDARPVELADVPPVLLSECRNDVRLMAAEGEGFREDWEKLTQLW